jgi:hypothetical protein
MWIVTGPISKKPFAGEGIDAITRGIVPIRPGRRAS